MKDIDKLLEILVQKVANQDMSAGKEMDEMMVYNKS